jgi:hypothetical protein
MSAGGPSNIGTAMEEGAISGHIYTEKVGNLDVGYGRDQVVSATAEVQASLNHSIIIDGIPWRLGAAYGAAMGSRHAGHRE